MDPLYRLGELSESRLRELATSASASLKALEDARWPDGVTCVKCESRNAYRPERGESGRRRLVICRDCGAQGTWRTGTALSGSKFAPEHIVLAAAIERSGAGQDERLRELVEATGFKPNRAARLLHSVCAVLQDIELPEAAAEAAVPSAPVMPPAPVVVNMPPAPAVHESVPSVLLPVHVPSEAPSRRPMVAALAALAVACVGLWLALGHAPSEVAKPLAVDISTYQELHASWENGGETRHFSTVRMPDESYDDMVDRHRADVAWMKARYRPDSQ